MRFYALLKPSDKTAIYYPLQQFRQRMLVLQRVSTEPDFINLLGKTVIFAPIFHKIFCKLHLNR